MQSRPTVTDGWLIGREANAKVQAGRAFHYSTSYQNDSFTATTLAGRLSPARHNTPEPGQVISESASKLINLFCGLFYDAR